MSLSWALGQYVSYSSLLFLGQHQKWPSNVKRVLTSTEFSGSQTSWCTYLYTWPFPLVVCLKRPSQEPLETVRNLSLVRYFYSQRPVEHAIASQGRGRLNKDQRVRRNQMTHGCEKFSPNLWGLDLSITWPRAEPGRASQVCLLLKLKWVLLPQPDSKTALPMILR